MFPPETRILVIDDMPSIRDMVRSQLRTMGFKNILDAADGEEALKALIQNKSAGTQIQLVISDWNMPGMQGIDLLKACKADPRFKSTPFMLVTAESEQKHILEAAKAGVSDYVVKPFNSPTLKGKMEKVYAKHFPANAAKAS